MSWITDVIVLVSFEDENKFDEANERLAEADTYRHQTLGRCDYTNMDWAGGNKVFCSEIWAAAFNHFPPKDILAALDKVEWSKRDSVVIAYDDEGDVGGWVFGSLPDLLNRTRS